jgi:hypothetical protein
VADEPEQIENPEEEESPPLEAVIRGLVKREETVNTKCVL